MPKARTIAVTGATGRLGRHIVEVLEAQGDGTHRLPVRAALRNAIGKQAGDTVRVRIDERIG